MISFALVGLCFGLLIKKYTILFLIPLILLLLNPTKAEIISFNIFNFTGIMLSRTIKFGFFLFSGSGVIQCITPNSVILRDICSRDEYYNQMELKTKKFNNTISVGDKIYFLSLNSSNSGKIIKIFKSKPTILSIADRFRGKIILFIRSSKYFEFWHTLIIGNRNLLSKKYLNIFKDSGLLHLLCTSGFHVNLILGTFYCIVRKLFSLTFFLNYMPFTESLEIIITFIFAIFYSRVTTINTPMIRAMIVFFARLIIPYPTKRINSVYLVTIIMLLLAPNLILDIRFQLSFLSNLAFCFPFPSLNINIFGLPLFWGFSFFGILANMICIPIFSTTLGIFLLACITRLEFLLKIADYLLSIIIYIASNCNLYISIPYAEITKIIFIFSIIITVALQKMLFTYISFFLYILIQILLLINF